MKKIKLFLGAYIDSVNAQDINCYNIAKFINKNLFEVHALTHGGKVNIPGVISHCVRNQRILKNIDKLRVMISVSADIYYLPRVEKIDILYAKFSKHCIISSIEIQSVYDCKLYKKFFNDYITSYFCISQFLNTLNIYYWGKSVDVLYLGVDAMINPKHRRKTLKTIVSVGSIIERKRPYYFLQLAERFPQLNFVMIGDGPLLNELKITAANKKVENIVFKGRLKNAEVLCELDNCDLLVMTSDLEGLPKVVLEAASKAIPSIYINAYYSIDYIEDGVNGYGVNTLDLMMEQIEKLSKNPVKYQQLSHEAYKLANLYSWNHLIQAYEQFFCKTYANNIIR